MIGGPGDLIGLADMKFAAAFRHRLAIADNTLAELLALAPTGGQPSGNTGGERKRDDEAHSDARGKSKPTRATRGFALIDSTHATDPVRAYLGRANKPRPLKAGGLTQLRSLHCMPGGLAKGENRNPSGSFRRKPESRANGVECISGYRLSPV